MPDISNGYKDEHGNEYIPNPEPFKSSHIIFNGVKRTLTEWANDIGTDTGTIQQRLMSGWTFEKALTKKTPRHKSLRDYDPESPDYVAKLTTDLCRDSIERLVINKENFFSWIDKQSKSDPMKVINALDKLVGNTARLLQQTEKQVNTDPAIVKIEFNTKSKDDKKTILGSLARPAGFIVDASTEGDD